MRYFYWNFAFICQSLKLKVCSFCVRTWNMRLVTKTYSNGEKICQKGFPKRLSHSKTLPVRYFGGNVTLQPWKEAGKCFRVLKLHTIVGACFLFQVWNRSIEIRKVRFRSIFEIALSTKGFSVSNRRDKLWHVYCSGGLFQVTNKGAFRIDRI